MVRRFFAAGLAACALAGTAVAAQSASDREQTEVLSRRTAERLQSLHQEADRLAADERTLLNDLRRLELDRDIRTAELQTTRQDLLSAATEVEALDRQIDELNAQAAAALPDLRARLVTLYKLGRGQYARMLLSASDLRQLGQAVRLVSALAEQDRLRVDAYGARLRQVTAAQSAARERQAQLQRLQAAAEKAQADADRALAAHAAMVHDIDTRRDLNAQYASDLLNAQQRLQASLAGFASAATSLPLAPFKGDLDWPVAGVVRQRFGSSTGGRPPMRGVEIAAPAGSTVHAVHDGTVAYADAFTGYGRLVIVDHGNQTFSLYGNLADLTAAKGTHVQSGSPVGTVGLAADGTAATYFELRVDGRPVDPLQWLTKR